MTSPMRPGLIAPVTRPTLPTICWSPASGLLIRRRERRPRGRRSIRIPSPLNPSPYPPSWGEGIEDSLGAGGAGYGAARGAGDGRERGAGGAHRLVAEVERRRDDDDADQDGVDEVLGSSQRLPTLRKEVLGQYGAIRQLVDGDAPLVEGPCDLDLEVLLRGLVSHDPVVVEASLS